ncbi:hypothetical protein [Paraglaciecola sp. MB-3u-78]|jgi:mono/diheme cytochrome c family protein|uniref:hypothetical protein n=1 Tax=Paraglaciecola sp. MB-3u-78 TaxID=2058332 RepID=UPI000C32000C|nr:hypothetical protein [Paraglaciecola sp. MB-3u-78]PKG96170.1 hypothetical protein CXF95_24805 [Paraglaciecola sp. MB-3u-78]
MNIILKTLKWLGTILLFSVLVAVAFIYHNQAPQYEAPYPVISASTDPDIIARGKYLFYGAAHCAGCHAPRNQVADSQRGVAVLPSGGSKAFAFAI